jgi:multisubunit Na+/H+ antiporter MnhC subunit
MKKSTRNLLYGIGALSLLSGVYAIVMKKELFDIVFGLVIGASLIGSVYFDQSKNTDE